MERLVELLYDEIVRSCECQGAGCNKCLNKFRFAIRKVRAHIPHKYLRAAIAHISKASLKEKLTAFLSNINSHSGLFVYGEAGTGKTYVLCAVLSELLKRGLSGRYTTCSDLVSEVQRGWYDDTVYDSVVAPMVDVVVLAIDDLRSNLTDKGVQALEDLLKKRYDRGQLSLVASRVPLADLESILGDRVVSVLKSFYKVSLQNVQNPKAVTEQGELTQASI